MSSAPSLTHIPGSIAEINGSVDEIVRPALERKIVGGMQHKKNRMEWAWNDTFKRGLRNALTGL